MAVMASPSAAFGARLNETVMAGNCPWWVIESGSVVFSKVREGAEGHGVAHGRTGRAGRAAPVLDVRRGARRERIRGGRRAYWPTAYRAPKPVSAFEPAEEDPDDANEVEAPAPVAPEEALAWM